MISVSSHSTLWKIALQTNVGDPKTLDALTKMVKTFPTTTTNYYNYCPIPN